MSHGFENGDLVRIVYGHWSWGRFKIGESFGIRVQNGLLYTPDGYRLDVDWIVKVKEIKEKPMSSDLTKLTDMKETILYKLRLNKLSKTERTLQKHGVLSSQGFLTVEGAQVFLDYLWQKNKEAHTEIADSIAKIAKDEKDENK